MIKILREEELNDLGVLTSDFGGHWGLENVTESILI